MLISSLKKNLGNSFTKSLEKSPKKFWKEMIKGSKESAVMMLASMVNDTQWSKEPRNRSIIQKGFQQIGKQSLHSQTKEWFKEIKTIHKIIEATDERTLLGLVSQKKKDEEKVKILETMVKKGPWDTVPSQRSAIDKTKDQLSAKALKPKVKDMLGKVEALDKQLKELSLNPQQDVSTAQHPTLITARILDPATSKRLKAICKMWNEKAEWKKDIAESTVAHFGSDKQGLASNSQGIINGIHASLPKKPNKLNHAVYIAYDTNMKVHAIMLVTLSKKKPQHVDLIATNPDNVVVIGTEQSVVRGAGAAVITHLANDVLQGKKYKKKEIRLTALPQAVPFYEKLGFKEKKLEMMLKKADMNKRLLVKPSTHVMQQIEPTATALMA